MVIYGVALLSACFLAGNFLGDILGALLHVKANVGGVGFAMLFLILLSNKGIDAGWLDKKSQEGIAFWSAMYIPIVVAMSSIQNVVAAISGGAVAILGGLLCTVFGFLLIPIGLFLLFALFFLERIPVVKNLPKIHEAKIL